MQKIKAAMDIECEEKVKLAMDNNPVEKQPESEETSRDTIDWMSAYLSS